MKKTEQKISDWITALVIKVVAEVRCENAKEQMRDEWLRENEATGV